MLKETPSLISRIEDLVGDTFLATYLALALDRLVREGGKIGKEAVEKDYQPPSQGYRSVAGKVLRIKPVTARRGKEIVTFFQGYWESLEKKPPEQTFRNYLSYIAELAWGPHFARERDEEPRPFIETALEYGVSRAEKECEYARKAATLIDALRQRKKEKLTDEEKRLLEETATLMAQRDRFWGDLYIGSHALLRFHSSALTLALMLKAVPAVWQKGVIEEMMPLAQEAVTSLAYVRAQGLFQGPPPEEFATLPLFRVGEGKEESTVYTENCKRVAEPISRFFTEFPLKAAKLCTPEVAKALEEVFGDAGFQETVRSICEDAVIGEAWRIVHKLERDEFYRGRYGFKITRESLPPKLRRSLDLYEKYDLRVFGRHGEGRWRLHGLIRTFVQKVAEQLPPKQATTVKQFMDLYDEVMREEGEEVRPLALYGWAEGFFRQALMRFSLYAILGGKAGISKGIDAIKEGHRCIASIKDYIEWVRERGGKIDWGKIDGFLEWRIRVNPKYGEYRKDYDYLKSLGLSDSAARTLAEHARRHRVFVLGRDKPKPEHSQMEASVGIIQEALRGRRFSVDTLVDALMNLYMAEWTLEKGPGLL